LQVGSTGNAVGGSIGDGASSLYELGVDAIASIMTHPMTLEYAMEHSFELLRDAVERVLRVYAISRK
jgi:glycerate kinase